MSRRSFWLTLLFALALLPGPAFAQKVVNVRRGGADFKTIIKLVTPKIQSHAAFPIRVPGDSVQRCGDWVLLSSSIAPINPKDMGDGAAYALLRKVKGKWRIVECLVGSGPIDQLAQEWQKKYKFPKALAK